MDEIIPSLNGDQTTEELLSAVDNLPIYARLQLVRNVLFRRYGSGDAVPDGVLFKKSDPLMRGLVDILNDVLDVIDTHPKASKLRSLDF